LAPESKQYHACVERKKNITAYQAQSLSLPDSKTCDEKHTEKHEKSGHMVFNVSF
jgi:hypothetical protein